MRHQVTQGEEKEHIPREIRNLDTSYNDATNLYKSLNDGDTFLAFGNTELNKEFARMDSELAFLVVNGTVEPTTFNEAWNHRSTNVRKKWREAIRKEFKDTMNYKVWSRCKMTNVPSDRRLIRNKWVFKIKRCGRFRAKLCGL